MMGPVSGSRIVADQSATVIGSHQSGFAVCGSIHPGASPPSDAQRSTVLDAGLPGEPASAG